MFPTPVADPWFMRGGGGNAEAGLARAKRGGNFLFGEATPIWQPTI